MFVVRLRFKWYDLYSYLRSIITINVLEFGTAVSQLHVDYTYVTSKWAITVNDKMEIM
jgi:hypothetical protein